MPSLSITNSEIVHLLEEHGYTIEIEKNEQSKQAYFISRFSAEKYKLPHTYTSYWEDHEIKKDLIGPLLKWSGLQMKIILDYI